MLGKPFHLNSDAFKAQLQKTGKPTGAMVKLGY
jgi:hypothetical protein